MTAPQPPPPDGTPQRPSSDATRPFHPHAARTGRTAAAGGERPSPTGTAPPRTPTLATAPAPSPGGRRPGTAGLSRRPADNRPAGRAARGRGPASPAAPGRGTRTGPAAGRAPLVVPRAADRPTRRPLPPIRPTDRFAELLLAVLSGQRPVHAMLRHTAGQAYDELVRLAERGPLRTRGARPVVRDIGWFEPREGAIEVFARIGAGDRLRAMAFRLERGRDLRWRCTAVELGGPRPRRAGIR
ncbi:Rv3235 family protein [Streptomyces griseoflavus]|uniref:Rv3235 family protein n=1 Tax=Streptomyces griseoflavus TaxID=35619 RepID=UPI0033AC20E4